MSTSEIEDLMMSMAQERRRDLYDKLVAPLDNVRSFGQFPFPPIMPDNVKLIEEVFTLWQHYQQAIIHGSEDEKIRCEMFEDHEKLTREVNKTQAEIMETRNEISSLTKRLDTLEDNFKRGQEELSTLKTQFESHVEGSAATYQQLMNAQTRAINVIMAGLSDKIISKLKPADASATTRSLLTNMNKSQTTKRNEGVKRQGSDLSNKEPPKKITVSAQVHQPSVQTSVAQKNATSSTTSTTSISNAPPKLTIGPLPRPIPSSATSTTASGLSQFSAHAHLTLGPVPRPIPCASVMSTATHPGPTAGTSSGSTESHAKKAKHHSTIDNPTNGATSSESSKGHPKKAKRHYVIHNPTPATTSSNSSGNHQTTQESRSMQASDEVVLTDTQQSKLDDVCDLFTPEQLKLVDIVLHNEGNSFKVVFEDTYYCDITITYGPDNVKESYSCYGRHPYKKQSVVTKDRRAFKRHVRRGLREFVCDECDAQFGTAWDLKAHHKLKNH